MTEPRRFSDYTAAVRAARTVKDSPAARIARDLQDSPIVRYAREAQANADQLTASQRESQRILKEIGEHRARRQREKVERERVTAHSAAAVAAWARERSEENRRLRYLTNILAFAVIYGVVNDSFDNHTWWTTLLSATVAVAVICGALILGRWRHRRQATLDEECESPA